MAAGAVALAVCLSACGTDDSANDPPATAPAATIPAGGGTQTCAGAYPNPKTVDAPYVYWVTVCEDGQGRMLFHNDTEAAALHIFVPVGSAYLDFGSAAPEDEFGDQVVATTVPPRRYADNTVLLPPGGTLTTRPANSAQYAIDMSVEEVSTAQAMVAAATAEWVEDRLKTPNQRVADSIKDCAQSSSATVRLDPSLTPRYLLQVAYQSSTCVAAWKEISEAMSEPQSEPKAAALADEALTAAAKRPSLTGEKLLEILGEFGRAGLRLGAHMK